MIRSCVSTALSPLLLALLPFNLTSAPVALLPFNLTSVPVAFLPFNLTSVSITSSLDLYAEKPDAAVQMAHEGRTLSSIHSALKKDALPWIAAQGAGDANRRRLIAATFALATSPRP